MKQNTEPAAQACGTLAPRYCTGKGESTRLVPAKTSGSRLDMKRSAASTMPLAMRFASSWKP